VHASEQDRPDVARRRLRWRTYQNRIDPRRLVFIDETWAKTNMAPLRGWCMKGRRLVAKVPHGHWKTLTFVAALRCDRIEAPCVIDGPINGESFRAYVEQILLPTLAPGDIVIMDNLGSHKAAPCATRSARLERTACCCRLTPPTSTRSNRHSPSSKLCCARPASAHSKPRGAGSATCSRTSPQPSVQTTLPTPAMVPFEMNRL
jgi:hypothetical protein